MSAIAADQGQSRVEAFASAKLDGLGQFIQLVLHQRFQTFDALELMRMTTARFRARESLQVGRYSREGLPVWLQVTIAPGQEKSTLPRFSVP